MHHSRVLSLLHQNLESSSFVVVVLCDCYLLLSFEILQLDPYSLQFVDLHFQMLRKLKVLVVYRNLLIYFKLSNFVLSVCIVEAKHHFSLTCNF